jgi:hypothetical protein
MMETPSLPGPTFIVIGPMKAGTTSLHHYLAAHPDIFMTRHKEPDYFVEEKSWSRGLAWYRSLFADGTRSAVRGESSTSYTKSLRFPGVAERMSRHFPDLKLIYLVRDPLLRAASHVLHAYEGTSTTPTPQELRNDHVLACSDYALQLGEYAKYFNLEQVLIVFTDDLLHHRDATYRRIVRFLDVEPLLPGGLNRTYGATEDYNVTTYLESVDIKTRASAGESLTRSLARWLEMICRCRVASTRDWTLDWMLNLQRWKQSA